MPAYNPEDNYVVIHLTDASFQFTATNPPSSLNVVADAILLDEVYKSSYILNWIIFDNAATALTSVKFELPAVDLDNSIMGYYAEPFLKDSGDGLVSIGLVHFLAGQNSTPIEGQCKLFRESGLYYIQCDVVSGNYDRFLIELNYQNAGN